MEEGMDPEIRAMTAVAEALKGLEADALQRVLSWAVARFGEGDSTLGGVPLQVIDNLPATRPGSFASVHDLFESAKPESGLDRILVIGYWFQVGENQETFDSQSVNTQLKDLGYASANITRDLGYLIARTPKLVIQTRKEGTTRQARKKYRLTREGIRVVETLLEGHRLER